MTLNVGVQMNPAEIAANIKRESEDPNLKGMQIMGVADPAIFDESRGESIAAMMSAPTLCTGAKATIRTGG